MINPLPVQPVKLHCPPPRRDVLSRPRLNGWLDHATAGRVALIIADAGSGKTTLLADWARHTTRKTAWYRLESDDRDWLTFIRHLVASGRELDPGFAPDTFALLLAIGPGGPTQQDLTTSLAREMVEFGAASERGLTLIFDDYHVVDGCPDTDPIVRSLLDRTAPGFSVVISSRSAPGLPMGKVRARGGVAGLTGSDLCFDIEETEQLFREAYRRPLQADLVADLHDRTEGWAALLTLVRTSLDERGTPDPRALVAQLSATGGDLYDFLAEEVLAGLAPDLQHFLTRVSVLRAVDVESAILVHDQPPEDIAATIRYCETLGLLSRPDRESPHRFHPLVREFLVARLTEEVGQEAVRQLHRSIAARLGSSHWADSAWHFVQGDDPAGAAEVIDGAAEAIIASGEYQQAIPFLDSSAGDPKRPIALILRSRAELDRGDIDKASKSARSAVVAAGDGGEVGAALLNLASVLSVGGFEDEAVDAAAQASMHPLSDQQRYVAQAIVTVREASGEGDLDQIADGLRDLAISQARLGLHRYAAISRLNLAATLLWLGDAPNALREATSSELALGGQDSQSVERVAATATRAIALAQLGRLEDATALLGDPANLSPLARDEIALETARIHSDFGSITEATAALARVDATRLAGGYKGVWNLVRGVVALRAHDTKTAEVMCDQLVVRRSPDAAGKLRAQLLRARLAIATHSRAAEAEALELARIAGSQHSRPGRDIAAILRRLAIGGVVGDEVERLGTADRYCLSLIAEEVSSSLDRLTNRAMEQVVAEARLRPARWRTALRHEVGSGTQAAPVCAYVLVQIGTEEDASLLRSVSRSKKGLRPHALAMTQRLAAPVYISDLGPVDVLIGDVSERRRMRRKVLGLLCFISSRPDMAATRDEALEALWPDLSPETGGNSLHQTIYSLRRVFEPDYREGMNAGYVSFDGDVVSLHPRLVDSASRRCWRLVGHRRSEAATDINELLNLYRGRYALDFAYEDWASAYREHLHAAVLAVGETATATARRLADYDTAIRIGHALLAVDPEADAIELELLKAYKASGRQAAAAEQYAHYAAFLREELAADVPSYEEI